uniref:Autophagy_act_C domain-containing protein n=1 Tax=Heterorhabditis bacteriophora TaxID=37862 RepID=A0A1I7X3L1_HETBA
MDKSALGICAKQSVMVKWRNETVNRQVHITYSSTYNVPVLWFNIYRRGTLDYYHSSYKQELNGCKM